MRSPLFSFHTYFSKGCWKLGTLCLQNWSSELIGGFSKLSKDSIFQLSFSYDLSMILPVKNIPGTRRRNQLIFFHKLFIFNHTVFICLSVYYSDFVFARTIFTVYFCFINSMNIRSRNHFISLVIVFLRPTRIHKIYLKSDQHLCLECVDLSSRAW